MTKLPPLIELRAFEAAARHLSFKEAADELGVTPTAISHQIRLLEQYCGRALFRRRPRPLSLTEAGARLFPVIRDGLEAFAEAIVAVKRDGHKQPLRVTTTNAFASLWLVPRLPRWRKLHPDAHLRDRHRPRSRFACGGCRRCHSLRAHRADRRYRQRIHERRFLGGLQSQITYRGSEEGR